MNQLSLLSYEKLARLVEDRIRLFIEEHKPKWLYVDFSAGKDSSAVLAAALSCCRDMVVATYLHLAGQTILENSRAAIEVAKRLGLKIYKYSGLKTPTQLRSVLMRDKPWENAPSLIYVVTTVSGMDYWSATLRYGLETPLERQGGKKRWGCALMKTMWLAARPPNGRYNDRPARFAAVGVRMQESRYRTKLWRGKLWQVFGEKYQKEPDVVLAPIVDMSDADVWSLLRHYGIYDIIRPQYKHWRRAPNCVICPMMGRQALRQAVSNLPSGYLCHVLSVLERIEPRYKDGTFSKKKIHEMINIIRDELSRRGVICG